MSEGRLRLVLGDQLTRDLSSLSDLDPARDRVLLAEVMSEASYVPHHKKKIAFLFSAMRHFAQELREEGVSVDYIPLDDPENSQSLKGEAARALKRHDLASLVVTEPGEWRLSSEMATWERALGRPVEIREDSRFLCSHADFAAWAKGRNSLRMEFFYREMRRKSGLLMRRDGQPEGGRWNFDRDNRARLPGEQPLPEPLQLHHPAGLILERIQRHEVPVIGRMDGDTLDWPVDREQSLALLGHFIEYGLAHFGRYQDAMSGRDWLLFHSRLSFSMNTKMLSAREVVDAALEAWRADPERYPLASVEGFVRQVIGWREYMRGIYWSQMPEYAEMNHFGHHRPLPHYYWDGETGMACMAQAIGQSLEHAYAHHIQRLMVTGNFALLAGIDPDAVDAWYLGIYIDAIEWVEMPNARGMSQFADGGIVASKPYSASGNYIRKMGDYCQDCRYRVTERSGPDACPFNSLYWHFMLRHREKLSANPRIGMLFRSWDRMDANQRDAILSTAEDRLANLERL